jgi:hypothetical protein
MGGESGGDQLSRACQTFARKPSATTRKNVSPKRTLDVEAHEEEMARRRSANEILG